MFLLAVLFAFSIFSYPVQCQNHVRIIEKSFAYSIAGMEQLLHTERQLLTILENYANELEEKADLMHSAIASMRKENSKSVENAEQYLSNPLRSYDLIRRMHVDWIYWELFMQSPVGEEALDMVQRLRVGLPTRADMDEAIEGIFRLQTTYDLKVEDIAVGRLKNTQYNVSLSSQGSYEVGRRLLTQGNFNHSNLWLNVALQRYQENDINAVMEFNKFLIMDLLAESFLGLNKFSEALDIIDMALKLSPNNANYLQQKSRIENEMMITAEKPKEVKLQLTNSTDPTQIYERCCRGEFDQHMSRLHCRYNSTTHPFLKLAPLKMEELKLDPYLVLYYDVITDAEIAELKNLSRPRLERNTVFNETSYGKRKTRSRTSKGYFVPEDENNIIKGIVQRVGDMSGFDMSCSEPMHVINYGLGGHYVPHYDAFLVPWDSDHLRETGNRIATLMFYLSDVEQGGATIFPNIETTVYPRKGSAILWYNLNNRMDVHGNTLHGACPVIVGSKWVMTKWIRAGGQIFRKPCYKE